MPLPLPDPIQFRFLHPACAPALARSDSIFCIRINFLIPSFEIGQGGRGTGRGKKDSESSTLIRTYRLPSNSKINTVTLLKVACSAIGAQREPRHS